MSDRRRKLEVLHEIDEKTKERFLGHVTKLENGCWRWDGCKLRGLHPQVRFRGQACYANRVAYLLWRGSLESGEHIFNSESCTLGGICVNPDHLIKDTAGGWYARMRHLHRRLVLLVPAISETIAHLDSHVPKSCQAGPCDICLKVPTLLRDLDTIKLHRIKPRKQSKTSTFEQDEIRDNQT